MNAETLHTFIVNTQREKKLRKDGQPRKPYTRKVVSKPEVSGLVISDNTLVVQKTRKRKPKAPTSPKPVEKPLDKSLEKASLKESPKPVEKASLKESPKSLDKSVEKPVEKSVEKKASLKESKKESPKPVEKARRNEDYAELMEKLAALMQKRGDNIRSRTYKRAQETILSITDDIFEPKDLDGKPGIGATILEKLKEFTETGTLELLEREKTNPENIFSDIYGVGPKKAKEIVEKGITTIEQLREKQDEVLNDIQKTGLKYYEDILKPIPRTEIDQYAELFKDVFDNIKTGEKDHYEIVGSYRRGKATSGDIDVILTASSADVFTKWVDTLLERKVIVEVLSRGKTKCLVITRLPKEGSSARRVDFLFSTFAEYPFAILYFTGSKGFNATMRGHALKRGVSLNEHGLSKMVDKKKEEKLETNIKTERDIFDYLELEYKEPAERIDGRAVVSMTQNVETPSKKLAETPEKKESSKKPTDLVDFCKRVINKK